MTPDMGPYPLRQFVLGHPSSRKPQNRDDDVGFGCVEIEAVDVEKRHERKKSDALVAVAVRVILDEAERIRRGERRDVGMFGIVPTLLRSC